MALQSFLPLRLLPPMALAKALHGRLLQQQADGPLPLPVCWICGAAPPCEASPLPAVMWRGGGSAAFSQCGSSHQFGLCLTCGWCFQVRVPRSTRATPRLVRCGYLDRIAVIPVAVLLTILLLDNFEFGWGSAAEMLRVTAWDMHNQ